MNLKFLALPLCVAPLILSGCASKYVEPENYSGFLKD